MHILLLQWNSQKSLVKTLPSPLPRFLDLPTTMLFAVSKEHRPFKQMIERLNRTYKASYRSTNGFDNIDGANYDLALWVAYYNFLRPHKHTGYKVLNQVDMLQGADNMPGKWQLLIFLGQQTILNIQKNGTAAPERNGCQ